MEPNGQLPQQNPYDYILNPPTAPKRPSLLSSPKNTKIAAAIFLLVVFLLLIIGFAVYKSATKKDYSPIVSLAERQTEIVRVADLGLAHATDPNVRIYVATVRGVTLSEKTTTTSFLASHSVKGLDKKLGLKKDTTTDKALDTALQNNNYDQVLKNKLAVLVTDYQKAQKSVTGKNDTTSEKKLFIVLLSNAKVLADN